MDGAGVPKNGAGSGAGQDSEEEDSAQEEEADCAIAYEHGPDGEPRLLRIGTASAPVSRPANPELVPAPLFYDIAHHRRALRDLLEDIASQERHLLLIGNQGVGKNKLCDRLMQLLRREREYVQLHRDSTVGSLTLAPSLVGGVVVWEDSPLVRAALHGRALVLDEVDKAPLEVVSVLKGIIEDGEMLLADGRRLLSAERFDASPSLRRDPRALRIHERFMIIALANRPGFPFHGNSFFESIGDVFATHVVGNPDARSELQLLRAYAPDVDPALLRRLVAAFADLRRLVSDGALAYPYSARECVAVARHLQQFPQDGLVETLANVLAFDSFDPRLLQVIVGVFQRHGVPLTAADARGRAQDGPRAVTVALAGDKPLPPAVLTEEWNWRA
jgi:MoxR-like ATPase